MTTDAPTGDRRQDVNTRKVIEVVTAHIDEALAVRLKGVVFWERLTVILGVAAVVIISAAWAVMTSGVSEAKAATASAKADVRDLRQDSGGAIQLVREELKETRTDIRSMYRTVRTNQPSPRLAAPVPELPPNPITKGE